MTQQRFVFIVSAWLENRSDAIPLLRGSVEQVGAGRLGHFNSLEAALEMLRTSLLSIKVQDLSLVENPQDSPMKGDELS